MIRVEDISHVRFAAPDLQRMRSFVEDFGLRCFEHAGRLYAHGSDGAPFAHVTEPGKPAFLGLGLRAASEQDLHTLASQVGAAVEPFAAPGGGLVVRLRDPDGNLVEVVAGQTRRAVEALATPAAVNTAGMRSRLRAPVRLQAGPARVHRLGHAVLNVRDFRSAERWYKQRFGFITSDEIEAAPGVALGAFLRCDRGEQPTDHHTLFLAQLPAPGRLNHAAFEVEGLDDLMLGHAHLRARGYAHAWGVGRHKLGSQIFDYWKDPWGHELEHWTDGDQFIAADGSHTSSVRDLLAVQWGTPFPPLAGRRAPAPETLGKLMALAIRAQRVFRGDRQERTHEARDV